MEIQVGDILRLKKQHPCGSREWEVLRIGADFRLKCLGCGHQIMIARKLLEKNVKEINPYMCFDIRNQSLQKGIGADMTEERTNWEMTQPKPPPIGVSNYKDACTNYY